MWCIKFGIRLGRVSSSIQFFDFCTARDILCRQRKLHKINNYLLKKNPEQCNFQLRMKNVISIRNLKQIWFKISTVKQFYCCSYISISRNFHFSTQLLLQHRFKIYDFLIPSFYFTFMSSVYFVQKLIDILCMFVGLNIVLLSCRDLDVTSLKW